MAASSLRPPGLRRASRRVSRRSGGGLRRASRRVSRRSGGGLRRASRQGACRAAAAVRPSSAGTLPAAQQVSCQPRLARFLLRGGFAPAPFLALFLLAVWSRCGLKYRRMKILDIPRSGSYRDITSSRNRFGQYVRTRAVPVNPQSVAQSAARSRLATFSSLWRSLDETSKAGWAALAGQLPRTDSLGQTYYMTGPELFVGVQATLDVMGSSPSLTAPAFPAFVENPATSAAVSAGAATLTHGAIGTEEELLVFATPPMSGGRNYFSDYRFIAKVAPKTAGSFDWTSAYLAKFGAPSDGSAIGLRARQVSVTGLRGSDKVFRVVWEN